MKTVGFAFFGFLILNCQGTLIEQVDGTLTTTTGAESGTIESENPYADGIDTTIQIATNCGNQGIQISSERFSLELDYDKLYINEHMFSGSDPISIHILGDEFQVHFTSDGSVNSDGFKIIWQCSVESDDDSSNCDTGAHGCLPETLPDAAIITTYNDPLYMVAGNIFSSSDAQGHYSSGIHEEIAVATNCLIVSFHSIKFDLENAYDKLTIVGLGVFTGSNGIIATQNRLTITDSNFRVIFDTDADTTKTGFDINWECFDSTSTNAPTVPTTVPTTSTSLPSTPTDEPDWETIGNLEENMVIIENAIDSVNESVVLLHDAFRNLQEAIRILTPTQTQTYHTVPSNPNDETTWHFADGK